MRSPTLMLLALWSFSVEVCCSPVLARIPAALESSEAGQCALLTAPWSELISPPRDWTHIYRLKVLPISKDGPNKLVFPEQPLFQFVRRVYRCCQMGHHCAGVKGIQGRSTGGSIIEFLLSEDVLSAPVLRAEVHLHLSNPQQLNISPLLPWLHKRHLPTRYSAWSKEGVVELRVDLLFFFQALQALRGRRGGASLMEIRRGGGLNSPWVSETRPAVTQGRDRGAERPLQTPEELGLALLCSTPDMNTQRCERHGVRLLHTPFITLSYG
ncbi:uncharacterized protein si:ch211-170d8.2 [Trichomycterus rosablanca]|uniref:uncharacterized protein si:ch211-170d8.2 n=1 Tax=Trichomycterus rosablanca TaxID=2290929 RepID=UPI002F35B3B9